MAWSKDNSVAAKLAAAEALTQAQRAELAADSVDDVIAEVDVVVAENTTRFLPAVATVALRDSTYPTPLNGDTVRVTGTSTTYRFTTGSGWVVTDVYNATAIDNVTAQLAETASELNMKNNNSIFFAHRGAEGYAPENTMKAFEVAIQMGFDGYELDTQVTSDGYWVLMHDDTVDRTTNGSGTVSSMTLAQIQSLNIDAGNFITWHLGLKVPLLKDALLLAKKEKKKVYVEVKDPGNDSDLIALAGMINNLGMVDTAWILGNYTLANRLQSLGLNLKCSIFYTATVDFDNALKNPNVVAVEIYPKENVTPQLVENFHSMGKKVTTGTINDIETARTYVNMGVDIVTGGVRYA